VWLIEWIFLTLSPCVFARAGVIPLLSFPRLVLENKMSASKFRHLLLSRPPFDWHFRDADGRTLLHVFLSPRRPRLFDHFHPARRFIEKLVSDKRLLRQLDLLAGDKDGHSLISRTKLICGENSPVPMNLMRAWQVIHTLRSDELRDPSVRPALAFCADL